MKDSLFVTPGFYQFYMKIFSKALYILPSPAFDAIEVFPKLFVSNVWSAYNSAELKKRNITHIVTVVLGFEPIYPKDFKYMNIRVRDVEQEDISRHFDEAFQFIDEGRETGNVLIHCLRGVSRSGTIAAAYVMKKNMITHQEALALLQQKRNIINPNPSFIRQLDKYYLTFNNKESSSTNSVISSTTTTITSSSSNLNEDSSNNSLNQNEAPNLITNYDEFQTPLKKKICHDEV